MSVKKSNKQSKSQRFNSAATACVEEAYFSTAHTATAVEGALATWLKTVGREISEDKKTDWMRKIEQFETLTPYGGFGIEHANALFDVVTWCPHEERPAQQFFVHPTLHEMLLVISFKGSVCNYAWFFEGSVSNLNPTSWVSACVGGITRMQHDPQLIVGIDPFSENRSG